MRRISSLCSVCLRSGGGESPRSTSPVSACKYSFRLSVGDMNVEILCIVNRAGDQRLASRSEILRKKPEFDGATGRSAAIAYHAMKRKSARAAIKLETSFGLG